MESFRERNSIKIYDKVLYWWCYICITIDQKIDAYQDYRANIRWIKKHGRH